jgi:hypothetical protein
MSGSMHLKGRLLPLLLALLALGSGSTRLSAEEPVTIADGLVNGDFEDAMEMTPTNATGSTAGPKVTSAAGWTALIGKLPSVITWGSDPKESPRKGGRFLRVTDDSPDEPVAIESTRIPAAPGGDYGAKLWLRSQDGGDPALYLNFYNDQGKRLNFMVGQAAKSGPYPEWTLLQVRERAPRGTTMVSVVIYSYPKDVGTYDFDDGVMGLLGKAPAAQPAAAAPVKEENEATVLNWQGKSSDPTAGVAVSKDKKPKDPAPVEVPTVEEAKAAAAEAEAKARKIIENSENPAALPQEPAPKAAITAEEKRALGIEPLPAKEEAKTGGMRAKPKPNQDLPPPWILPSEAEKK